MAMNILISNDDGIQAKGLMVLKESILKLGYNVFVSAPSKNQSATSHSLTLNEPLRINRIAKNEWEIDGTPTDCVLIATHGLIKEKIDFVISGINHGANMGEDVLYSGTLAAAMEGLMMGIPSAAMSLSGYNGKNFNVCFEFMPRIIEFIKKFKSKKVLFNVNFPSIEINKVKGIQFTSLGTRIYSDKLIKKIDPRGRPYYWIGGSKPDYRKVKGTDFYTVMNGYISITPIKNDLTDKEFLKKMKAEYNDL